MLKYIKGLLPSSLRKKLFGIKQKYIDDFAVKAYSQEGEDMILNRFFGNKKSGFYVDIGAHHPTRFSNTFFFYQRGWRGINIDAMPGSMDEFKRKRGRDINLELAISDIDQVLNFYIFDEPAVNSFSVEVSEQRIKEGIYKLKEKKEIKTITLKEVLDKYLPRDTVIDFMSIDVEGLDFQVVKSNDWEKYAPSFLLIEFYNFNPENLISDPLFAFLKERGYAFAAKAVNTIILKKEH